MNIQNYPYGRPSKALKKAVKWLNKNQKILQKIKFEQSFDFPDYWEMPKSFSHKLGGDEVDWLQDEINTNWKLVDYHDCSVTLPLNLAKKLKIYKIKEDTIQKIIHLYDKDLIPIALKAYKQGYLKNKKGELV